VRVEGRQCLASSASLPTGRQGWTSLHYAIGKLSVVKALVEAGVDFNAKDKVRCSASGAVGNTPEPGLPIEAEGVV
jgi:hypothetical protein